MAYVINVDLRLARQLYELGFEIDAVSRWCGYPIHRIDPKAPVRNFVEGRRRRPWKRRRAA